MKRNTRPTRRNRPARHNWLTDGRVSKNRVQRQRRRASLLFESLENRMLLAGNVLHDPSVPLGDLEPGAPVVAAPTPSSLDADLLDASDQPRIGSEAEGEDAVDLVAFAKALSDAGAIYYGAAWCPACNNQKALFEDGGQFLPFVEVTNPDRTLNAIGTAENITQFPTWVMPDGDRFTGVLSLQELSDESGVPISQGSAPSFTPLDDVTVLGGAPLHVGLDGYDPNGTDVTFTISSSNPSLVTPELRVGRSLLLETSFGDILVGAFEDQVPRVTDALFQLVEDDVWDNTIFHRVINGFVIQGGDPTGTGFGDSNLPKFDDQFHVDGQHTSSNLASTAKAGDDSASSQFFFTEGATRHLDFNHTVWGLIVEGASHREAISNVATGAGDRPTIDVTLIDATVFEDPENAVLTLKAPEGASGTATITVTATDSEGLTSSQSFQVTVTPDTTNGSPFLRDIPDVVTTPGTPISITLTGVDVEGDAIRFNAFDAPNVSISLPGGSVTPSGQEATATLTITPDPGFVGTQEITVFVHDPASPINPSQTSASQISSFADVQTITLTVLQGAPSGLDLAAASDSGTDDSDDVTNDATPQITVDGVVDGALVQIFDGGAQVAEGTASGTSITLTTDTLGDGVHTLTATQTVNAEQSAASPSIDITIDTVIGPFTSTPGTTAELDVVFSYDAEVDEEGDSAFVYDLLLGPDGASIDPATGQVTWTPVASQIGLQSFSVQATDLAGNTREQSFDVDADGDVFAQFHFEIVDDSGNALSDVEVGDEFTLRVLVEDPRRFPAGVFAAYLDVMFEQGLVEVISPVEFGGTYTVATSGDTSNPTLIDEAGAASGSLTPLGGGPVLLFTVDLRANIAGTETIFGDPADEPTTHDILVYQDNDPVSTALVDYGGTTLNIGLGFGANGDLFNFDEDSSDNTLNVLSNDDSTGTLTITGVSTPSDGGTVTINGAGDGLIYTPAADFNGSETFTYTVSDSGVAGSDTATVVVQVHPINDDPTANDDVAVANQGETGIVINVLDNDDIAPDTGETLRVLSLGTPSNGGTVSIGPGGRTVVYDAPSDFTGVETFSYTIDDENGGASTATVSVTVSDSSSPQLAFDDTFAVDEDSSGNVLDVLNNDDPDGAATAPLQITLVQGFSSGGTVSIVNGGTELSYTPAADFSGVETFTYVVGDANGNAEQATVSVTVASTNDAPTAIDDDFLANNSQSDQTLDVLGNDTDPDSGDLLTISEVSQGSQGGALSIASDGRSVLYTPAANFLGDETFTYSAQDPSGESTQATATVTVSDFVPSSLAGFVYLDLNNNGVKDATERPVVGVTITLSGTDDEGNDVTLTQQTTLDGSYSFEDLAPGQYTIAENQPDFLRDGIDTLGSQGGDSPVNDQFSVTLAEDTDGVGNNFGERGREARAISLLDMLASTHDESVVAALDADTDTVWYAPEAQWTAIALSEFSMDGHGSFQLQTDDGLGGRQQAFVAATDAARIQVLDAGAELSLLRFVGSPQDLHFAPVPGSSDSPSDSGGEGEGSGSVGEGESPFATTVDSLLDPLDSRTTIGAEGEGGGSVSDAILGDPILVSAQSFGNTTTPTSNTAPTNSAPAAPIVDQLMTEWDESAHEEYADDLLLSQESGDEMTDALDEVLAEGV